MFLYSLFGKCVLLRSSWSRPWCCLDKGLLSVCQRSVCHAVSAPPAHLGLGKTALQSTYGSVNNPQSHPVPLWGEKGLCLRRVGAGPWQLPGSGLRASPALVLHGGCSCCPAQPGAWCTSRASGNIFWFQPKPILLICRSSLFLTSLLISKISCENVMYLFLQRVKNAHFAFYFFFSMFLRNKQMFLIQQPSLQNWS